MEEVFISYSHKDEASARALKATLDGHGLRTWIASEDLHQGESWAQEITGALERAKAVVLLIGNDPGHWARAEWSAALRRSWEDEIRLVPVVLNGADPPAFLHGHHAVMVSDAFGDWERVAHAIEDPATLDAEPLAVSPAPELSARLTLIGQMIAALPDEPPEHL
jgi:TIR domain